MSHLRKILVTGANGFVGTELCRALAEAGYAVRRAVRVRDPIATNTDTVAVGEFGPATIWAPALKDIELVVHLAARAHVTRDSAASPLDDYRRINVLGTETLALAARNAAVRRLVFVSSIKVNGESTHDAPLTEEDPPRPDDDYGLSKWEAEQALWRVAKDCALQGVVLRPPLLYGAGVKGNFLALMNAVARGIPLPLASLRNKRSLLYVGNLVDAIAICMEHPAATGKTYLLADDLGVSTAELVRAMANALGRKARLAPCPPALLKLAGLLSGRSGVMSRLIGSLQVDSNRIRNELGWQPRCGLEEGLRQTAQWYYRQSRSH